MPTPASAPKGRVYEPPKIFRVKIAGDELAVSGCKTNSAVAGPNPPTCLKSICKSNGS